MSQRFVFPCAVVLVATLLLLVSPGIIGAHTETSLREWVARVAATPYLDATVEHYRRGWFGAEATVRFGYDEQLLRNAQAALASRVEAGLLSRDQRQTQRAALAALVASTLPVQVRLDHGPLTRVDGLRLESGAARFHLEAGDDAPALLQLEMEAQTLLDGVVHTDFSGNLVGSIAGQPLRVGSEREQLAVSPWLAEFTWERVAERMTGSIKVDELAVGARTGPGMLPNLRLASLVVEVSTQKLSEVIWRWQTSALVDLVEAGLGPAELSVSRAGARTAADLDGTGRSLSVAGEIFADGFSSADQDGSLNLPFRVEGLPVSELAEINALVQQAMASGRAAPDDMLLLESVLDVYYASPSFRLGPVALRVGEESLNVDLLVQADGQAFQAIGRQRLLGAAEALAPAEVISLLQGSSLELALSEGMAAGLMRFVVLYQMEQERAADLAANRDPATVNAMAQAQSQKLLARLVSQRLVTAADDDGYELSMKLGSRGVDLNGKTLPLALLPEG